MWHTDHNQSVEWATRQSARSLVMRWQLLEEMTVNHLWSRAPRKILLHSVRMITRKVVDQPKTKVKLRSEQQPRNVGFRVSVHQNPSWDICKPNLQIQKDMKQLFPPLYTEMPKDQQTDLGNWKFLKQNGKRSLTVLGFVVVVNLQIIITN